MHEEIHNSKSLNIVDIFPEYKLSKEFLSKMILVNTEILNKQFKTIGEMITFINSQNYYGDTYQERRALQIEAAEYWSELFLMKPTEFKEQKTKINDISFISNKINMDKVLEFEKTLVFN